KKQLEEGDFARLKEINESDNYDMLGSFIHRLSEIENSENLRGLEHFMRDLLDERSYLEFLINCGLIEKAGSLIESSESLDEESKFSLYMHIDKGSALEFAYRNGAFSSLINYFHSIISDYARIQV
ncbi:hypothetical protein KKH42_01735, partial [bacterium]|nr:hypothetical protein [bacterium]